MSNGAVDWVTNPGGTEAASCKSPPGVKIDSEGLVQRWIISMRQTTVAPFNPSNPGWKTGTTGKDSQSNENLNS